MKLKIMGDGTPQGTYVVDISTGQRLVGLKEFSYVYGSTSTATLCVEDVSVHIDPNTPYDAQNYLKVPHAAKEFYLKIVGDGQDGGSTTILNEETNEEIEHPVLDMTYGWDVDHKCYTIEVTLEDLTFELTPKRYGSAASSSSSSSSTPTSYQSSYGYQPTPPSAGPSSGPPPQSTGGGYMSGQQYSQCPSMPSSGAPGPHSQDPLLPFDQPPAPSTCQHEWVNVSLLGVKMVCKHCNIDKP